MPDLRLSPTPASSLVEAPPSPGPGPDLSAVAASLRDLRYELNGD